MVKFWHSQFTCVSLFSLRSKSNTIFRLYWNSMHVKRSNPCTAFFFFFLVVNTIVFYESNPWTEAGNSVNLKWVKSDQTETLSVNINYLILLTTSIWSSDHFNCLQSAPFLLTRSMIRFWTGLLPLQLTQTTKSGGFWWNEYLAGDLTSM